MKDPGTFVCRGCGALLLQHTKYDLGTGWPSFFQPINRQAIDLKLDYKLLLPQNEASCDTCDGHLGHVFEDRPDPTGQQYCIIGAALTFQSDKENPKLALLVTEQSDVAPYQPSVGSQVPTILFNGAIGIIFFASDGSRIGDIESIGATPNAFDFFQ